MVITNGVTPSERMLSARAAWMRISRTRKRNRLLREKKNSVTQTHEHSCETTVARLDPRTPISSVKMKMGSSTMLMIAPTSTEPMAMSE